MLNRVKLVSVAALLSCLNACAAYQPVPLASTPTLKSSIAALARSLPDGEVMPVTGPLSLQMVAKLAVLNDPTLIAARLQHGVAKADLLNASLLPDPVIGGNFAALISGPANAPSISGSLMQDISALITYRATRNAARRGLEAVDADILWQEWQVATQAAQLCIAVDSDTRLLAAFDADEAALQKVEASTNQAVAAGDLTIAADSASLAALAAIDTARNQAQQNLAQDQNQLDALLNLAPGVMVPVSDTTVAPVDRATALAAIDTLATRRPDLIALRYGNDQADSKLRAAIMSQFLPITVGVSGTRDTSKVVSVGPSVSLTLPLFNRNRGGIALAAATQAQLAAQYTASLDGAAGGAHALLTNIDLLTQQSRVADGKAEIARSIAAQGQAAFANHELDAVSAVALQTASSDRAREAISLHAQLLTARLSLDSLLGLGLPTLASQDLEPAQ